jgi:hypothetical protein
MNSRGEITDDHTRDHHRARHGDLTKGETAMTTTHPAPKARLAHRAGALAATAAAAVLLTGCSGGTPTPAPPPAGLLLSGPNTNIVVTIPAGWHQIINSANPIIPEMVAPADCMGSNETACSLGLARIATITAPNLEAAATAVEHAVTTSPGVTTGPTISAGPGKVGTRDGYLHRFTFSNPGAHLTSEIAAVPSGPQIPDAHGNHEYSLVLVWVSDKPGAPTPEAIDQIISSALVTGGVPPTS